MKKYDHNKIEKKWQKEWEKKKFYRASEVSSKQKCYVLDMFPYPSGDGLHVGHPKGYIATDIYTRYKRMTGHNVLHPMGWDAFGLPAENYAIKNKVHPRVAVEKNVAHFKEQLEKIGFNYDWNREINTTDPKFYKWTQWIFLKLLEKGLAYQSYEPINWCSSCQTGLANEDLDGNACERCGTVVEKKPMRQWMLKITDYAEKMLADLDQLDWPESIKESQRNWIGRSEGAEIVFPIVTTGAKPNFLIIHGYTGRADKNFIPWLAEELREKGYEVQSPQLPNTDRPVESEQVGYVLDNCKIDRNTIVIGHSLGAIVAMKAVIKHRKPVQGLVLIGAAMDPMWQKRQRPFHATFDWNIDFDMLQENTAFRTILSDLTESERAPYLAGLAKKINAALVTDIAEKEHFTAEKEPLILNELLPTIKVFTTRPDTLFGCTYCVLAPEHPWLEQEIRNPKSKIRNKSEIEKYIEKTKKKTEIERTTEGKEKTGLELKGVKAVNSANGEEIPIFVADYVLGHYGTGAIMAVPAHDERDFEFATRINTEPTRNDADKIAIRCVVFPYPHMGTVPGDTLSDATQKTSEHKEKIRRGEEVYAYEGTLINSGKFDGLDSEEAKRAITEFVGGEMKTRYKLRDWVFSRQRYWGEPIPVVHCEKCALNDPAGQGVVPVPEKDLPVVLPEVEHYEPTGTGESPLVGIAEWVNTVCPKCGGPAKRETNTMPQWAGSSWYYLRYIDPKNDAALVDKEKEKYWSPVDMYVGGAEHATRHLIYARFWHKFLFDLGAVNYPEPFLRLQNVGLIHASDGCKMSKRYGNVINPDDIVATYGADTLRVYEMFMGPFDQSVAWSEESIVGPRRFLERVWRLCEKINDEIQNPTLETLLHKTIKKVGEDIETFQFNTAISALMICVNEAEKTGITKGQYELFLRVLAPFAPHIAEEIWSNLKNKKSIHLEKWPKYDELKVVKLSVKIAVQINGKMRAIIDCAPGLSEKEILEKASLMPEVKKWVGENVPKKTFYVKDRALNIVI